MLETVHVGTILVKGSPQMPELFALEVERCSGNWNLVTCKCEQRPTGWKLLTRRLGSFQTFLPDIVLLDIGMPLLNGIEACPTNSEGVSRVRNHFPDRKFVERCKGRVLSSRRRRLRS